MSTNPKSDGTRPGPPGRASGPADDGQATSAGSPRSDLDDHLDASYEELRRLAHRQLAGERPEHTLRTTALVHEAYLKLAKLDRLRWKNRAQFCAEAARAMRRVLIDHATRRNAEKRGGGRARVERDVDALAMTAEDAAGLLDLNRSLEELAQVQPRAARVVECRFFGGMTGAEIADTLELSPATVDRDWRLARAWLNRALSDDGA